MQTTSRTTFAARTKDIFVQGGAAAGRLSARLKNIAGDTLNFFYPNRCAGCGAELHRSENLLCQSCLFQLPFTRYERYPANPVFLNLAGRINIEYAAALLDFKKHGIVQRLLHQLKYENRPDIGRFLGMLAGETLKDTPAFSGIDLLVPVPLHREKEKKRGYNQSVCIAEGLCTRLPADLRTDLLQNLKTSPSQTGKDRLSRWENVKDNFRLNPEALPLTRPGGRHFLLIDDVFTTGATLESCARALQRIPDCKISVLAIATPL